MPNKFTPALDAVYRIDYLVGFFDAIFGNWVPTKQQQDAWDFINANGITISTSDECKEEKQLFWCFIAELSDEDLQECFPELFSSFYQGA